MSAALRKHLSEALEHKRLLSDLADNKGFLLLSSLMQAQADDLQQTILFTPCSTVDSAVSQEYKKGQLEGRLAWEKVREAYLSSLELDIENLKEQINDEPDESNGSAEHHRAP